ncbi:MAG TPA: ATP-binding protein [Rhodocyclaceae bacterium]|nr:ATP-binding protein [Rhodocyclaceae bacterium]
MAVNAIPVDQRVIDIDSRRFASIEKALVELITNADDSYARLERAGVAVTGRVRVQYERHRHGALLTVADQAEGLPFDKACAILSYGGAHSLLAQGMAGGRGYFGRGLKQAIFGLGSGWLETIHDGRLARIELFRGEDGAYLYDDGGHDREVTDADRERLGIPANGTRVAIVVDSPQASIAQFGALVHALANNIYLRDVLVRRHVEVAHLKDGTEVERSPRVQFEEPPSIVLLGPELPGQFQYEHQSWPFTLTLKRALDAELTPRGDERTSGLLVLSGTAVLDCQFFDYENQVGTEYLFGTVRCPALVEKLAEGEAVISDERAGLNPKAPIVAALSRAVSRLIAPHVQAEQDKLRHLERATTSGRTAHMIEHLLERMNLAAIHDFGIGHPPATVAPDEAAATEPVPLRFTTPFYYRKPDHAFHVRLLLDPQQLGADEVLSVDATLSAGLDIEPLPGSIPVATLGGEHELTWTVRGAAPGERGELVVRAGGYIAWCEIVIAEHASGHAHHPTTGHAAGAAHARRHRPPRDHGEAMFTGYAFRYLGKEADRAVYSAEERRILINTAAPTVQLYVDGRGNFRDSARLLLAELFLDVIADELARYRIGRAGRAGDVEAFLAAKRDIVCRYGSDIHLSFMAA